MAPVLGAFGSRGAYLPIRRDPVHDIRGRTIAELALVPPLFVQRTISDLNRRRARPSGELAKLLADAGELFANGAVGGVDAAEHHSAVAAVSGLPISVVRAATEVIAEGARQAFDSAYAARPVAAAEVWTDIASDGRAVWVRRGHTLAVNAAGNHPGVHALWLEALALGYGVAVRPSRREPFTAHRLVSALLEVGFTGQDLVLLPGDQGIVGPLLQAADLGLVYGGDDVVQRYRDDPRVLSQGPGRSKILLTGEIGDREIALAADSIAHQGGTACVNATAVFVEGDHVEVAGRIADRLAEIAPLPPEDPAAVLPCCPEDAARAIAAAVVARASGTTAVLSAAEMVASLGDGSAALRPTLYTCDRPDAPQAGLEMPFPCAWVLPWTRGDVAVLRDSLVLAAVTEDRDLITQLVDDPTIRNVYLGDVPTIWMKFGVPHDGFLGEFLMRSKAVALSTAGLPR